MPTLPLLRGRTAWAVVALLAVTACGSSGPDRVGTGVTPTGTASSTSSAPAGAGSATPTATSPAPAPTAPPLPGGVPGPPTAVATGLPLPWSLVALPAEGTVPAGRLLSLRDEAQVLHLGADGTTSPVATTEGGRVPGTTPLGEGGLLGLAVLVDGATTWVYAYQTVGGSGSPSNQVVRMPLTGDAPAALSLGAPEPVLTGIPAATFHNGGRLGFGPDGMLYVTTGDAGDTDLSQDPSSLGGKILRLTPEGDPAPGNPVAGSPVWSLGHRNVQGIGWDARGRMFASEFGQDTFDEVNLIEPGRNYGWPVVEGAGGDPAYVDPLVTWSTDEASPSGLAVTADAVHVAALRGERLWRLPLVAGPEVVGAPEAFATGELGRLRDVLVDPDPSGPGLLVLTNNVGRRPGPQDDQVVRFPLR